MFTRHRILQLPEISSSLRITMPFGPESRKIAEELLIRADEIMPPVATDGAANEREEDEEASDM